MKEMLKFIYGAMRGILRRLSFDLLWHGLLSNDRRIIKMTGIGNCETRVHFYPSVLHFLHNTPYLFRRKRYDYLIAQNFLHDEFLSCPKPKLFFTLEPSPCMTPETTRNMQSERAKPFLYLYDEPDIKKRMFYPCFADHKEGIIRDLERMLAEKRSKLCCIINRYSEHPGLNLLQQRMLFVKAMGNDIDIYGAEPWGGPNKWREFPNYYGMTDNKLQTLRNYNFVIAFENSDYPGYITEKVIDAFKAGTVPLYWGGGAFLKETIPSDCYIDCRNREPEEVYLLIKNMTQEDIVSFRKAALEFLKSDAADRFTGRYLKQEIVKRLEEMG